LNIAVVGAGASGLTAAIRAAFNGAHVTLFERNDKVGKKILVTGNGKCNISNVSLSEEFYYSSDRDFVVSALDRFGLNDTVRFFESLGLLLTEKRGGLYPFSEQAATVLDALRFEADYLGVETVTNSLVTAVRHDKKDYVVEYTTSYIVEEDLVKNNCNNKNNKNKNVNNCVSENHTRHFDRVIISTGGKAAPKTGSDGNGYKLVKELGHKVSWLYPGLCGLKCRGDFWKSISGVRCNGVVSVIVDNQVIASDIGEVQFVDYGISGIPVFQVSRTASFELGKKNLVKARIDLMPEMDRTSLASEMKLRLVLIGNRTREQFFNGFFNKKIVQLFLKMSNLNPREVVTTDDIDAFLDSFCNFEFEIMGNNGFDAAQVTAGGVPLSEIDMNFESRLHKGLYLTGELLDVDGKCGGYNLQWAWASGYLAGEAASYVKA